MTQGVLFGEEPAAAPAPEPVPVAEPFVPLVEWLPGSRARDWSELEPWQLWQLAWYGSCRVPA